MSAIYKTRAELITELRASHRRWTALNKILKPLIWQRAELQAIYKHAPVLLCTLDKNRHVLYANRAFCKFTGVPEKELLGGRACGVFGCINALDDPRGCGFGQQCSTCELRLAIEDSAKTGRIHRNVEYRAVLERKGVMRQILLLGSTVRVFAGRQLRLLLCLQDITEKNLMDAALRESEARLRSIFEHSIAGILLTAPDGRVFAANPAACRILGRTEEDICRLGRSGLIDGEDARIAVLLRERAEKGYAAGEINFIRADGLPLPVQMASAVFETEKGLRTSMVFQDITERKLMEQHIQIFSRKLLAVREEERRSLSAVLHNEVGSAAVSVSSRLNAAEEDILNGNSREALAALKECHMLFAQATKRLKMLAENLRPPDLDLLGLRAALRRHFERIRHETPLRILFTDTIGALPISPDVQTFLFRACQEFLNNVIRHADARHVRVNLSVARHQVRLSFGDDGKGFNPDRWVARPGRHLGLHSIREMAAAMGGTLDVVSKRGAGTKVIVKVPGTVKR